MTALSAIRTAWAGVTGDANIKAYTTNLYTYDIVETVNKSVGNSALFLLNGETNFVQFIFSKDVEFELCGMGLETFNVIISYYREIDITGVNYHKVTDFFGALFTSVDTKLGTSWSSTVDFYTLGDVSLSSIDLDGRACWSGSITYTATKEVSL